ncbi:hypothetical protein ZIOFF_006577 [Zingiber officinale]|uniref:Uncharacterized protein n=1 Tax=Zingiber officinale TaxID=94328 RepID=A0A8J5HVQ6_ZINOF|nr:hypothetical protein ZIOFF_006577 [Zingiber officinale]
MKFKPDLIRHVTFSSPLPRLSLTSSVNGLWRWTWHGELEGGGSDGGGRHRPLGPLVCDQQIHSRRRLHNSSLCLPADAIQEEAEELQAQGIPVGSLFQGPLQWNRRGKVETTRL